MFVGERMSSPVITIHPELSLHDALQLMQKERIRRLPVVDKRGQLVGIVSEGDLLHASPSDATSLSVWELNYLLSKATVKGIMTREVVTVGAGTPLEEAALIMAESKIGGLPVVNGDSVVGIITETDLFKAFLELLGAREQGVRVAAVVKNAPGKLAELTKAVFELGGNIVALGTFMAVSPEERELILKVEGVDVSALEGAIAPYVTRVIDVRSSKPI